MEDQLSATQDLAGEIKIGWKEVWDLCTRLALRNQRPTAVYGIPAGGIAPALILASHWGVPIIETPAKGCLVVDDLVDSGRTATPYLEQGFPVDTLVRKPYTPSNFSPHAVEMTGWVSWPWEHQSTPTDAVVRVLEYIGEDPNREGLRETPKRVLKAWKERRVIIKTRARSSPRPLTFVMMRWLS